MADLHKRPGTITFVAVMLFVFAVGGIFSALSSAIPAAIVLADGKPFDPNQKPNPHDLLASARFLADEIPGYTGIVFAVASIDLIFAVLQVILGVGCLRLKPFARTATTLLILIRLIYTLAYETFAGLVMVPAALRFAELQIKDMPKDAAELSALVAQVVTIGAFGCGVFVQMFVTSLIVYLLNNQTAKAAFAGEEPEKPTSPYEGYEVEADYDRPSDSPPETGFTERT